MSELLDKMNQQFTDMQKLATDYAAMAEQALNERDKARDALRECKTALERDITLLDATRRYLDNYGLRDYEVHYDKADCDGYCLQEDCTIAENDSLAAIQSATNALEGTK